MVRISIDDGRIALDDPGRILSPTHRSMLALWRLVLDGPHRLVADSSKSARITLAKVANYLRDQEVPFELDQATTSLAAKHAEAVQALESARQSGRHIKLGTLPVASGEFLRYLRTTLPRRLLWHQEKAAVFMLNVPNSANFSVPGSGKSSVVLALFAWLRQTEAFRSLFVVGPQSSFVPWQHEYRATLGEEPCTCVLAGRSADDRRPLYYPDSDAIFDLYLTTYHTLWRDAEYTVDLLRNASNKAFFVIDEATMSPSLFTNGREAG